jgi:predicted acylesterase/phospholipase RssA
MVESTSGAKPRIGLILTGGGARAAYQVGFLRAVSHMLSRGTPNPFQIICGSAARQRRRVAARRVPPRGGR